MTSPAFDKKCNDLAHLDDTVNLPCAKAGPNPSSSSKESAISSVVER